MAEIVARKDEDPYREFSFMVKRNSIHLNESDRRNLTRFAEDEEFVLANFKHDYMCPIAILDSGASVHFVENGRTLSDVRSLQSPIRVSTVANDVIITTAGYWSGIGEALLHPTGMSNIVSMSRIILDGFSIEADEFMFLVQHSLVRDKCLMFTLASNGLFECAMSHIREFGELMEEAMSAEAYHYQVVNTEEEGVIDLTKEENSNGNH